MPTAPLLGDTNSEFDQVDEETLNFKVSKPNRLASPSADLARTRRRSHGIVIPECLAWAMS